MRPLRRILSISEADLQTIGILNCTRRLRRYHLHRLFAIDVDDLTLGFVIGYQGQGLTLIGLQPLGNNLLRVVGTHNKSPAVDITDAFNFGRLKMDVIDPSAGGTSTTPCNPLQ